MNLDIFTLNIAANLREAMEKIELNKHGIVLVLSDENEVVGLATDGDIRRKLLAGAKLEDAISDCINVDFVWAAEGTPRETLLKKLDQRIRVIPVLDGRRRLVNVVWRDYLPELTENSIFARARAPVRVSFGGGGSDVTHFFEDFSGAVMSSTISLYCHATMCRRRDSKIIIDSRDLDQVLKAENLDEAIKADGCFGLFQAILRAVKPDFGFELYVHSDFPVKSGLGGSSVVVAAVLGCFNEFRMDRWNAHEIAELAFQAERLHLSIAGGWQDQYAAVFGGFNFMEFNMERNLINPLRLRPEVQQELEESLILCDTGSAHESGDIHIDQKQTMKSGAVHDLVVKNVDLCYQMKNQLLRGELMEFGQSLHSAWNFKKQFSSQISNSMLDDIYSYALGNGAVGGKLLGAGGGGFFLFFVTPFKKHQLMSALNKKGLKIQPFRFESNGLQSWTVRENSYPTNR